MRESRKKKNENWTMPDPIVFSPSIEASPTRWTALGLMFLDISKHEAEDALLRAPCGAYVVRPSSKPLCAELTYVAAIPGNVTGGQIGHLVMRHEAGVGWTCEGRPTPVATLRDLLASLPYGLKLRPI